MAQSGVRRQRQSRSVLLRLTLPALLATTGVIVATPRLLDAAEPLTVSVGGPADDPAFLPVHAAAALGTLEAEGVLAVLRRAKHPTAALAALRDREAAVAVTTLDQAVRSGWGRGTPVRILVVHTRAPAAALLASATAGDPVRRVEDLRGRRVGIPGPGTTGHLLLVTLLRAARIEPWQLEIQSLGGATLAARLGSGDLAAAVVEEPWASRAVASGAARVLLDFRRAEEAARQLGGPFYEIVSVVRAADKGGAPSEAALTGFARALIRVQTWLAATPAADVTERLPAGLVGDRERFVARLAALQGAYAPTGETTDAGLAATFRILRNGSPWPATLKVEPSDMREPGFVTQARARLGSEPPPP